MSEEIVILTKENPAYPSMDVWPKSFEKRTLITITIISANNCNLTMDVTQADGDHKLDEPISTQLNLPTHIGNTNSEPDSFRLKIAPLDSKQDYSCKFSIIVQSKITKFPPDTLFIRQ